MLRLRPYKKCDAEKIVTWCKDELTFRRWSSDRFGDFPLTKEELNRKYFDLNGDCEEPDNFYPFTAYDDDGIAGSLIMRYTDAGKLVLRIGFVIVDDEKRGKGYGKKMLLLALKYAFELLCAEKVTIGVFENNAPAYNCRNNMKISLSKKYEFTRFIPLQREALLNVCLSGAFRVLYAINKVFG